MFQKFRSLPTIVVFGVFLTEVAGAQDHIAIGHKVYLKSREVEIQVDNRTVGTGADVTCPVQVQKVQGDLLWIPVGRKNTEGWVKREDVCTAQEAITYFSAKITDNASDATAYFVRQRAYEELGQLDAALDDASHAIKLKPDAFRFAARGFLWFQKDENDTAIQDFDEAIRLDPKFANAYYGRAEAYSNKKAFDQAIADYDEVIRLRPKYALAFSRRGLARLGKGEADKAIADFDEALRFDPSPDAYVNRGFAYTEKGDRIKAIADYDAAIRLDPKKAETYIYRGDAHVNQGNLEAAIADFDQSIRLDPKNDFAFTNRGNAFLATGEYGKAIADHNQAVQLNPKSSLAHCSLGDGYLFHGDLDKAIAEFDEALRLDPQHEFAYFRRGMTRLLSHQRAAEADFQKSIDLGGWRGSRACYAVIFGHFATKIDPHEEPIPFLKKSEGKLPTAWPYPVVRFLQGKLDEAPLLRLADDGYKKSEAHCFLGLDHFARGRKNLAKIEFEWVVEHGKANSPEYAIAVNAIKWCD